MELKIGLAVDKDKQERFALLENALNKLVVVDFSKTVNWSNVLNWAKERSIDVLIIDESLGGKKIERAAIEELLNQNAMMNIALASSLPHKEFHEVTEGLGILMELSMDPSEKEAGLLVDKLIKIYSLLETAEGKKK